MNSRKPRNTKTRDIILRYMMDFADEQGRQPSVREIGEAAGLMSTSTTAGYLRRMVKEGLGTGPCMPRPRAMPRASSLLPAPISPSSSTVSPAVSIGASCAARAIVSDSECVR